MPRGGAHFSTEELVRVLSHYDTGVVHGVKSLWAGNRRAPKVIVTAEAGKFLLKRRPRGRDDPRRVRFAHKVQKLLSTKRFPIAPVVPTSDDDGTFLQMDNHIYELFKFVDGMRYDGSADATRDAGRQLGRFHEHVSHLVPDELPLNGCFHDSTSVRKHLKTLGSDRRAGPARKMQAVAESLMVLYNDASVRVSQLGADAWNQQVIHGDWHPGNMLFRSGAVVAVVDFDGVRMAPAVTDLANGMLQFSIVGGRPNPADWPDYFDEKRLARFLEGYREAVTPQEPLLESLPDLMVETMIAEAVLPIAVTGFFGHLSGLDFLQMILRKAKWLNRHRRGLRRALGISRASSA